MKKICLFLCFVLLCGCMSDNQTAVDLTIPTDDAPAPGDDSPVVPASCVPSDLEPSLLASYNFAEGSLLDGSGNNNNLAVVTAAIPAMADRNGNENCALRFNGTDYLKVPDITFLQNLNKFSISVWFNASSGWLNNDAATRQERFFLVGYTNELWYGNTYRRSFYVGQYDCSRVFTGNGSGEVWESETSFPTEFNDEGCGMNRVGIWYHVVVNFDSDANIHELYVNGVQTDIFNNTVTYNQYFNMVYDVFIGKGMFGGLDDMFIFNKVLNQQEVENLYYLAPCCN